MFKTSSNLRSTSLIVALGAATVLALPGCKKEAAPVAADSKAAPPKAASNHKDSEKSAPINPKVKLAADIAREISQSPERADEILQAKSLDRSALEDMMYEISSDPELRAAYNEARRVAAKRR